jgi:hypothetical protein
MQKQPTDDEICKHKNKRQQPTEQKLENSRNKTID